MNQGATSSNPVVLSSQDQSQNADKVIVLVESAEKVLEIKHEKKIGRAHV